jgi:hypothetical protein
VADGTAKVKTSSDAEESEAETKEEDEIKDEDGFGTEQKEPVHTWEVRPERRAIWERLHGVCRQVLVSCTSCAKGRGWGCFDALIRD